MKQTMIIEKKRNGEHVSAVKEFKEEYDMSIPYHKKLAFEAIEEALRSYEQMWEEDYEHEEAMQELKQGDYDIDTGDYTYTITIRTKGSMRDMIEKLLESDVTGYQIEKHTGFPQTTITKLRKGSVSLDNISFINAEKLYEFAIKKGVIR